MNLQSLAYIENIETLKKIILKLRVIIFST